MANSFPQHFEFLIKGSVVTHNGFTLIRHRTDYPVSCNKGNKYIIVGVIL